jgi:hypothetical protein
MISSQIERLKKDSRELNQYARKMEKRGRVDIMHKVLKRQAFIDMHIEDMVAAKEKVLN